jgi:hypothetical protein
VKLSNRDLKGEQKMPRWRTSAQQDAARTVAIRVIGSSVIFGQRLALAAAPAEFVAQGCDGAAFSVASFPSQES